MPPITVRYRLVSVEITEFTIYEVNVPDNVTSEDVLFNTSVQLQWKPDTELVHNVCIMNFTPKDNKGIIYLSLKMVASYQIENFNEILSGDKKIVHAPDTLLADILNTTISTARGFLMAKVENTKLSKVVYPTFDSTGIIVKMKEEQKQKSNT